MSVNDIDRAPLLPDELAGYFERLPIRRLQRCWVGAVVGLRSEGASLAELARALIVVRERLHGVPPVGDFTPQETGVKAVPLPRRIGGIDVCQGPAPPPSGRSRKSEAARQAAAALKPGEWFVWVAPPACYKKTVAGWAAEFKSKLLAYRVIDADGKKRAVVRREVG